MNKKIKYVHGQDVSKEEDLSDFFNTKEVKITLASVPEDIDSFSLEKLIDLAESLNIRPVNNKKALLKSIKAVVSK